MKVRKPGSMSTSLEGSNVKTTISGKTWEVNQKGDEVVFKCKLCGFTVRAHVKNYDIAYREILLHIAETHATPSQ